MKFIILIAAVLFFAQEAGGLICFCNNRTNCSDNRCTTDGLCHTSLKLVKGTVRERSQCLDKDKLIPIGRPIMCQYNLKNTQTYISGCCGNEDLCNMALNLTLTPGPALTPLPTQFSTIHVVIISLGAIVVLLTAGCLVYLVRLGRCKGDGLPCFKHYLEVETQSCDTAATTLHSLQDILHMSSTGSGSGLPILLQRTIARQIQLKEIVGKGRFGEVQRGEWRGENVAVKIFSSIEEQSWFREVEIYQTSMLRHDNILGFIAADNKDIGTWTQLWLVTQYMALGSLFDFLTKRSVTEQQGLDMCLQITTGLAHLHLEIIGTQGKPAIAHRDLKSKNILVRHDGVCAVGDLGLAVRYFSDTNCIDVPSNSRVGTKRYLSPEVLDGTILHEDFESYKQGDIYALGLVFWEILHRVNRGGEAEVTAYQPPYWDQVGIDPSIDEMRKVVCIDQSRPELPDILRSGDSALLQSLSKLMMECWYSDPAARLSILRLKKSLAALKQETASANPFL